MNPAKRVTRWMKHVWWNGMVASRGEVFVRSLPSLPSADVENTSLLCLVAEVCACMLIEQKLACSQISWPVHLFVKVM